MKLMVGKPWERLEKASFMELAGESEEYGGGKLRVEHLRELGQFLEDRNCHEFKWLLDDVIESDQEEDIGRLEQQWDRAKYHRSDAEAIRFLVDRLSATDLSLRDWKFGWLMKKSGLQFTERQLLKIVERLGATGNWRHALSVVDWAFNSKSHRQIKSRFVYTKLLAVLGKARRPYEALRIFNVMRGDCHIYPDMAAYHSIAVTLGQAGLLKELINVIECIGQKPSKKVMRRKNWDPLEPDLVIYNAVLNACVAAHQWKGVFWVFEQLRVKALRPNGASYGLAMEVMLQSGKYDLVHKYFDKMRKMGEATKALTYKVIVRAYWEEGKVNEAIKAVRDMEQRGIVGTACVYYELACCLCNNQRWQEAIMEVEKLKKLPHIKPLPVAFTGMIISAMDGGHVDDCISIFEHMKYHCTPNIGTINAMLKVYGKSDMFSKAKELFEEIKEEKSNTNMCPDVYTYRTMLEASASTHQWEYFEYLYKEMVLCGYQLDHCKHSWLLVEASRAGKCHLLEHAFYTILEAEEIPSQPLFSEMVCQATAKNDYERAVTIVNTMAHAPFKVSEQQWKDLFDKNGDRISTNSLGKLLHTLRNYEVAKEETVLNLIKSLDYICRFGHLLTDGGEIKRRSTSMEDSSDTACIETGEFDDDLTSLIFENSEDDNDDLELDMKLCEDNSHGSNLPSAYEILEEWKESRKKDGIVFPLQLCQK